MEMRRAANLTSQSVQRTHASEQARRTPAPAPGEAAAEAVRAAAQDGAQRAPSPNQESQNHVNTAHREAAFEPNIKELFSAERPQGSVREANPSDPAPDPIGKLKKLVNVGVYPGSDKVEESNLSEFRDLLNDMSPEQLAEARAFLQNEIANIDPMRLGGRSLAPDMLELVNEGLINSLPDPEYLNEGLINSLPDPEYLNEGLINSLPDPEYLNDESINGLLRPPPIEGLDEMISITKYRDGGQTERATVEKLKSLANNLSSEQLRETQQWLMEQINEYRQATPPPGKAFLAPRFLSYVDSLISSMQPVETP